MNDKETNVVTDTTANSIVPTKPEHHLKPINSGLTVFNEKELAELEVFAKRYIQSDKSGLKSIPDVIAIAMRAKDLNLPFSTCAEHIHVVSGKTGIDVHITKALLSKGSITWDCIDDYSALYEYTDGFNAYTEDKLPKDFVKCSSMKEANAKSSDKENSDNVYVYPVRYYKDFNGNVYREYQLNGKFGVAANPAQAKELASKGLIPVYRIPAIPVDYVTSYVFHRNVGGKETTAKGSFSYSDAVVAGCFEKDTYKKYPKIMISHRAFMYGARDIASDLLMGCMSIDELNSVANTQYDEDVEVIDITPSQN